jgi:CRISPR system Cascade subunit CasA
MIYKFDLIEEPWIPVLHSDGTFQELGLFDVFAKSSELREIAHDSPLFVASIQALLTTISHRTLQGTTTRERISEWSRLWKQKKYLNLDLDIFHLYFAQWRERFDLFHPQTPFYQVGGLEVKESSPIRRLAMEENNTSLLFANDADPDWQMPSAALAARLLVTTQSYALGFGKSSRAMIQGREIEPPYSADGPLLRGLTIWASGDTLFQTLMLCLVPHELSNQDAPCWEIDRPYELRDSVVNGKRHTTTPRGICDLLTLQSRLIRLIPEERDGQVIVPKVYFTQGRSLEKDDEGRPLFHPFKLYTSSKKEGYSVLSLSENRAIWRNAHALISRTNRNHDKGMFNALHWIEQLTSRQDVFDNDFRPNLNVVGMATEPGKAGKFLLWRHDRMPLPPKLLTSERLVGYVESANKDAENVAEEMRRRFSKVARTFIAGQRYTGLKSNQEDIKSFVSKFDPRRAYWSRLETHFYNLLQHLPDETELAFELWENALQQTAQECLRAACNSLGTSLRAITAVAQIDISAGMHPHYLRDPTGYFNKRNNRSEN